MSRLRACKPVRRSTSPWRHSERPLQTWVTVTDSNDKAVGIVTASRLIAGYRRALTMNTERLSKIAGNAVPVELCVAANARAAHLAIRDASLPAGTMIVTVERHGA